VIARRGLGKLLISDGTFELVIADDAVALGTILLPAVKTPVVPIDLGRAVIEVLRATADRAQKVGLANLDVGRSLQQGQVVLLDGIYDLLEGQASIRDRLAEMSGPARDVAGPVCDPRAREFHPAVLIGRDDECRELAGWFLDPSEGYRVVVGGPWAGKTAVMSELALVPHADVDVVSFFVRAVGRRNTGALFLDVVNGQLRRLLGQRDVPGEDLARRRSAFEELWAGAMSRALRVGRGLVLLVDGLDEQDPDDELPISALLPGWLGPRAKVLVATRPNPQRHPALSRTHLYHLAARDPLVLAPSDHGRAIGELAGEAVALVAQSGDDQLLMTLGLLTVAEGALTTRDLADLVGCDTRAMRSLLSELDRHLIGRGTEDAPWELGHVELLMMSRAELAEVTGLLGRCERAIDRWADRHHDRGWPPATPRYLLTSYWSMLERRQQPRRLAWLVGDAFEARAAVAVRTRRPAIDAATAGLRSYDRFSGTIEDDDIRAICTLAVRRVEMFHVAGATPAVVVGAWSKLGAGDEVIRLLDQIPPDRRLAEAVIAAATDATPPGPPTELLSHAESVDDPWFRHKALVSVALAVVARDPAAADTALDRATEAAGLIRDGRQDQVVSLVVEAVVSCSSALPVDVGRIRRIIEMLPGPSSQSRAWVAAGSALAPTDQDGARSAFERAEQLALDATRGRSGGGSGMADVVAAIATHLPSDRVAMGSAVRAARGIEGWWSTVKAWTALAAALATRDPTASASAADRAGQALYEEDELGGSLQQRALRQQGIVAEVARLGFGGSEKLLTLVTQFSIGIECPVDRGRALIGIASALARHEVAGAEAAFARIELAATRLDVEISPVPWRGYGRYDVILSVALARVSRNPADPSTITAAAQAAQRITEPYTRCRAWLDLADVLAALDVEGALRAIAVAGRAADETPPKMRATAQAKVASSLAATAPTNPTAIDRARTIAAGIDVPDDECSAWSGIACALAPFDASGALAAVQQAERAVGPTASPWNSRTMRRCVAALAACGADVTLVVARAEQLAMQPDRPEDRVEELTDLAKVLSAHDPARALILIERAMSTVGREAGARHQCWAWARIAAALAGPSPAGAQLAIERAEGIARSVTDADVRSQVWSGVVQGLVAQQPPDPTTIQRAVDATERIESRNRGWAQKSIVVALCAAAPGDPSAIGRARRLAERIDDPSPRAQALEAIVAAMLGLHAGDRTAVDRAEQLALDIDDRYARDRALVTVVSASIRGDALEAMALRRVEQAERVAGRIEQDTARCEAHAAIASALTRIDLARAQEAFDRAEQRAEVIEDAWSASKAWTTVASALAGFDPARMRVAFDRAEQCGHRLEDAWSRSQALIAVASARAVDSDRVWPMLARMAGDAMVQNREDFLPTLIDVGGRAAADTIAELLGK
jgi:hypothetical protein